MDPLVLLADRYELGDVIGRGGMADVHHATDRVLHRPVAVKVLRDSATTETDRLRFTAEAQTLARLNHPHLVTVLDAGVTCERPFLVMELVRGVTLGQLIAGGPMDPARVRRLGAQVAAAVAYAHGQGVIHRDVKPANVLVGEDDQVKLADFGIARLIGDTVRHTATGDAVGTAAYLSPEQVRGDSPTPATDVYALGLLLLEALTGERAYPGTPVEAALARLNRRPHVPDHLSPAWRDLLLAMTTTDPVGRPSAGDVAEQLRAVPDRDSDAVLPDAVPDRALVGPPTVRVPVGAPVRSARLSDGFPGQRSAAAAVAVLALVIAGASLLAPEPSVASGDDPAVRAAQQQEPVSTLAPAVATAAPVTQAPVERTAPKRATADGRAPSKSSKPQGKAKGSAKGKSPGKARGKGR